jgi:hypothetical protein
MLQMGRDDVAGIETCHRPDGPGIEYRWRLRFFTPIQTGHGAHATSYTRSAGSFLGRKRRGVELTSQPPFSIKFKERVGLYSTLLCAFMACSRESFTFTFRNVTPTDLRQS